MKKSLLKTKNYSLKLLLLLLLLLPTKHQSANRYWVSSAGGNWNNTSNWSTTSGGTGGATIPGASDVAIFNASASGSCNLNVAVNVLGIQITGYTGLIKQGTLSISIGNSGYSQNSGTFTGGSAAISVSGAPFTLSGGVFTSTSNSLTVGGVVASVTIFVHSGGAFNHNSGSLVLNPTQTCTGGLYTVDVLTTTQFNNLTVNMTSTCSASQTLATASGDTLDVTGFLQHIDGTFNGLAEIKGAFNVGLNADGGTGWFILNGTANQSYSWTSTPARTAWIKIDKTGGIVSALSTTNISCQGFFLQAGNFSAPTGSFNIGGYENPTIPIFTHVSGTFTPNSGTVIFDANFSCGTANYTVDVTNSTSFYNLEINTPSCGFPNKLLTAAGDTIDATNNLTHTDGAFHGLAEIRQNFLVNAGADGGTGWFIFDGTSVQTYSVISGSPRTCGIKVAKSSGTVSPASGTNTFACQAFEQTSGVFTAPSGTFMIGGPSTSVVLFSHQGGTFTHNSGTVMFDASNGCATGNYTADVISSTSFYNINLNLVSACGTNYSLSTAAGDTLEATNHFVHTDGYFNGIVEVKQNLVVLTNADGGTGWIIFNGSSAQQYSVSAGTTRTSQLKVDKASGTVTPGSGTTDLACQGFFMVSGAFTAPTGSFSVGGPKPISVIFSHTGGSFLHNNGTVVFDAYNGCGAGFYTVDVITSTTFSNINVNLTSFCGNTYYLYGGTNDTIDVRGDLTHNDGFIFATMELKKDLIINSTADGGFGWLVFNSTGTQTYFYNGPSRTARLKVNKTAGAVVPSSTTTALSCQRLSLLSGSFTAPSGNLNIGGSEVGNGSLYQQSGGSFVHNNGTVIFDAYSGCAAGNFSVDVISATKFYNVIVNLPSVCSTNYYLYTTPGDTVDVTNDLVHADGYLEGLFELKGNLSLYTTADGGTGWIIFNGTVNQTYAGNTTGRTCSIKIFKSSGAVSSATGYDYLYCGAFSLQSGSFSAPATSFSVGGPQPSCVLFEHVNGTFNPNNGTTYLTASAPGCPATTYTIDVNTFTSFYNLNVAITSNCGQNYPLYVASNDTVDVDNTLSFNTGWVLNNSFECQGDVFISSTFLAGSTSKLILNGSNSSSITATGATNIFDGPLVIAKQNASKTVKLLSELLLDGAGQSLTFTKGRILSGSTNSLTIGDNVTVASMSDSSYVDGPVGKTGNDIFTFPVGKTAGSKFFYRPVSMGAPASTTDQFSAEYFFLDPNGSYLVTSKDATLDHISRREYWNLLRNNGTSNVSVSLTWRDSTSGGVNSLPNLRVAGWNGSLWKDLGNGGAVGNNNIGFVTSSGAVSTFGPFALASANGLNPLPIELVFFEAVPDYTDNTVLLKWKTQTEHNSARFRVERTTNNSDFLQIAEIPGAGNSSSEHNYACVDSSPYRGVAYYRLKQTDFDGTFSYSPFVAVEFKNSQTPGLQLLPNPAHAENVLLKFLNWKNETVNVSILDPQGKTVYTGQFSTRGDGQDLMALPSSSLASGVYLVKVTADSGTTTLKMVLR